MTYYLFLVVFLYNFIQTAGQSKLDSLSSLVNNLDGEQKGVALLSLSNEYIKFSKSEEAVNKSKQALQVFLKSGNQKRIIDSYNTIASSFIIQRNRDSIYSYANSALILSDSINYMVGKGNALKNISASFVYGGNTDEALKFSDEATSILENSNNKISYAAALIIKGVVQMYKGQTNDAVETYNKAGEIYRELGDSISYANTLINIGSINANVLGEYEKAMDATLRAQKIYEELNYSAKLAYCKMIIGTVYEFTDRIPMAIENYQEALRMHEVGNNTHLQGVTLNYIGEAYNKIGEYKRALVYYKKSLELNEKIGHDEGIAIALHNIGSCYQKMNDYEEALAYYLRTHKYFEKSDDKAKIAESLNGIADVQLRMNSIEDAVANYLKSIRFAKEADAKVQLRDNYADLSQLYISSNDYRNAYKYLAMYNEVKDSLFDEQISRNMAELEKKYEAEKKSREIEILKRDSELKELSNQRQNIIIISLISISLVLIIAMISYYRKYKENIRMNIQLEKSLKELNLKSKDLQIINEKMQIANKQLEDSENDLKKLNATKDKFFSIIAHDLRSPFNTLNSYIAYISENIKELSNEEINALFFDLRKHSNRVDNLLENLLNWSLTQFKDSKLSDEIFNLNDIILKNYELFEKNIREKGLKVRFKLNEKADVKADSNMIDVVVRNILKNAIKYTEAGGKIEIETSSNPQESQCIVRDSGIGMDESKVKQLFSIKDGNGDSASKGVGLGMVICKEFIDKNSGRIEVASELNHGTEIKFSLPKE
ncbi:MAG: tetratricopeptide repeat protein [Melioribacteraceae bacterium]|nr:tetratricopeptide repeat protein [Melioribacteraceae bacterium]